MFFFSHSNLCPSTILKCGFKFNSTQILFTGESRSHPFGAAPAPAKKGGSVPGPRDDCCNFFFTASGEGTCRYSAEILAMLGIFLSVLLRSSLHVSCN